LPIYEYRCVNGHTFEVMQSMSDDPIHVCQVCGAPVERVFHPVAVHFKGSGFYTTDYGRKRGAAGGDSDLKRESKSEAKSDSKSDSKSDAKGETKEAAASKSDSSSSSRSSSSSSSSDD
jgi:putative FmdB family regulatory protein